MRAAILPVTAFQQNCTLLWCTATMRGAFVDPGGDLPRLKAAAAEHGVTIEKILLTHGHIDHCGSAGILAAELGVPIEGPHEDDRFWIDAAGRRRREIRHPREIVRKRPLAGRRRPGDRRRIDLRRPPLPRPHPRPCRLPPRPVEARFGRRRPVQGLDRPHRFPARQSPGSDRFDHPALWPMGGDTQFRPRPRPDVDLRPRTRHQPVRRRRRLAA